jgi:hypothetical protein
LTHLFYARLPLLAALGAAVAILAWAAFSETRGMRRKD